MNPAKSALLVVDIDYYDNWRPEDVDASPKRQLTRYFITEKISWARENNLPVIFIMLESRQMAQIENDRSCICIGCSRKENKLPDFLGHRHEPFEPVFVKTVKDAFTHPDLVHYLNKIGAEELLLIGCSTFACILATAKGAIKAGFDVTLMGEATYPPFADDTEKDSWIDYVRNLIPSNSRQNVTVLPL